MPINDQFPFIQQQIRHPRHEQQKTPKRAERTRYGRRQRIGGARLARPPGGAASRHKRARSPADKIALEANVEPEVNVGAFFVGRVSTNCA